MTGTKSGTVSIKIRRRNNMDLKTATNIIEQTRLDDLKLYEDERHKLMMRVVDVCEYGNLDDLKRLNKLLEDNNFAKKK
tara:strand:+ start:31 stop:267 length:237 start_codon:yes stop_codon:yes gene_type:complete